MIIAVGGTEKALFDGRRGAGRHPGFLAHALDDETVPPENSLAMTAALRARRTPVECHLFEDGGHGFGVGPQARSALAWPDLFMAFARRHGV